MSKKCAVQLTAAHRQKIARKKFAVQLPTAHWRKIASRWYSRHGHELLRREAGVC